jgi:signal transduction histidine kinase
MKGMMRALVGRSRAQSASDALIAFVQSLGMHGTDEMALCSGVLDVIRAYVGERPCCIWKNVSARVEKLCERGMVEIFLDSSSPSRETALSRTLASGSSEFEPCRMSSLASTLGQSADGFLHIPIKNASEIMGILTLAVSKKEARDHGFVTPFESLGRLLAMALRQGEDREVINLREKKLRAEVESTTRELEQTNSRLIDRVKELKMLYNELQKRVQELTQANRAKNEFLSIVSHELRTPLTSITGFLSVLLDEEAGPLNEQQKRFLTITKQSSHRLNFLISDLLDISRIEAGKLNLEMEACSLREILQKSVEGLKKTAVEKKIQLALDDSAALPNIWGDPSRLQQVSDNLISNAIKFTPSGGTIRVSAAEKGDFIKVSVTDNGPGLSLEEQEKVFDMFYQADASTRRSNGGAGLGLAIARGIISMHGGQLWVESVKGTGSTFSFMVPRNKAQKAA